MFFAFPLFGNHFKAAAGHVSDSVTFLSAIAI